MNRRRRLGALAARAVVLGVVVVVLARSGDGPLAGPRLHEPSEWAAWLESRTPIEAAFALLRLAALGASWYLAATTVVGLAARLGRARRLTAAADTFTLPVVRRLLQSAVGVGVVATTLVPAASVGAARAAEGSVARSSTPSAPAASTLTMRGLVEGAQPAAPAPPPAPAEPVAAPAPPADATRQWEVQPGHTFWSEAARTLEQAWGRAPSDGEVVPYWERLIEANRGSLADPSNPDLIYPGQVFTVPEPGPP